ncbi:OB-fold domain-containing protein [Candidatus Collierbacteria bacterium]|nr:OB-fold domain-containing protein [Candidatus Collierbacteria bacterium]
MKNNEFGFSGIGAIYSWTRVERDHAPAGFVDSAPYYVVLVGLDEGPRVTAMLTDLDVSSPVEGRIKIGQKVEMVTKKLQQEGERGMIVYGYKFRPVLEQAPPEFLLGELADLAQRSAANPKDEKLNTMYEAMFKFTTDEKKTSII